MPHFNNISNELYLEILEHLPPPDFGSFYCVNKHLYALTAKHRIRHQELKRRFSKLNTKQPGSTARLIKSILGDPKIALYVQHFTIDGLRDRWGRDQDDMDAPEHVEYSTSDMEQLAVAVRDSEYFSFYGIEEWITAMKSGEEHILIALALTLFPNVTSIDYQTSHALSVLLGQTIRFIVEWDRPGRPLTKLSSANFNAPKNRAHFDPYAIEFFASLPPVKVISVDRITCSVGGAFEHYFTGNGPVLRSHVTDLNISCGEYPPQRFMPLVQSCEQLHSFTYWSMSGSQPDHLFNAFPIVTTLLASARSSLRELEIRAASETKVCTIDLRKFHALELLDIDASLLFEGPNTRKNFYSLLPPSIREVKLHGWRPTPKRLRLHFTNLTKARSLLPLLSSIELFETDLSRRDKARLQKMCAKVNISQTFARGGGYSSLATSTRHRSHYAERQAKKVITRSKVL